MFSKDIIAIILLKQERTEDKSSWQLNNKKTYRITRSTSLGRLSKCLIRTVMVSAMLESDVVGRLRVTQEQQQQEGSYLLTNSSLRFILHCLILASSCYIVLYWSPVLALVDASAPFYSLFAFVLVANISLFHLCTCLRGCWSFSYFFPLRRLI